MSELNASVVIDLNGNLQTRAARYANSLDQMANKGSRSLGKLQRSVRTVERGMDKLANRYLALATGAGAVTTGKMLVDLDERFTRLGIQANESADVIGRLKREIFAIAQQDDIRIDPSQLTSAVEEIVEKTGDLEFARENLDTFAMAISATGAAGQSIGGIGAEFQKMGIIDPKGVREALDILTVQGKEGAFTLQNLAALGPRVVTAYTSMGRGGVKAILEMGAALQVIRQGTGSSEMAATAFEAVMRTFSDASRIKKLVAGGIQVFDPEQAKLGKEVLRPVNELMVDIIKAVGGKKTLLSQVFDAEAIRAFNAALDEYNRTGGVESLNKFMNVQADGTELLNDSTRAAKTSAAALRSLYTAWQQFADSNLTQPIVDLADSLNSIDASQLQSTLETAKDVALALGAIYIGIKTIKGAMALRSVGGSIKGGGPGGLAGAAASLKPIPVFVVNNAAMGNPGKSGGRKGKGFTPPKATPKANVATKAAKVGRIAKVGAGAAALGTTALGVVGAAAIGWGIGSLITEAIEDTAVSDAIGSGIAHTLALFGNDSAQAAITAQKKYQQSLRNDVTGEAVAENRTEKTERNHRDITQSENIRRTVDEKTNAAMPSAESIGREVAKALNEKTGEVKVSVEDNRTRITQLSAEGIDIEATGPTMVFN